MPYVNIAGYKFTKLTNLNELQAHLKQTCLSLNLKGTILLSEEGINAFLCGERSHIDQFLANLPSLQLGDIPFKESPSQQIPFKKLAVKIKAEIVTMGIPGVSPAHMPVAGVSARQFKQWLDEEKSMILLDTRNEYEARIGNFKNALHLNIDSFRAFPEAIKPLLPQAKNTPIIAFCTGGIRAEKAVAYMQQLGFQEVYQLEGGILKYFEECGSAHYEGECFVFDKRIAVDTQLQESATVQCFTCRQPVTPSQQHSEQYQAGNHCPHCYQQEKVEYLTT